MASDWLPLLRRWSRALLQVPELHHAIAADVRRARWLGYPGATEEQLAAAEKRLGIALPPSYRTFLSATNGWRHLTPSITQLWPTEQLVWLRDYDPELITAYVEPMDGVEDVSEAEYRVYGPEDLQPLRTQYLETALALSPYDDGIILLNPQTVTEDGEWEAWFFANWVPGAVRYPSFLALMQAEYDAVLRRIKHDRGEPTPYAAPSLGVAADDLDGLLRVLQSRDRLRQLNALDALANLRDARALDALTTVLLGNTEDDTVREQAARTIGAIGDQRGVPILLNELRRYIEQDVEPHHPLWRLVGAIEGGLYRLGTKARPALFALLRDHDARIREAVGRMLCFARGLAGSYDAVSALLADPDTQVRATVARTIEQLFDPRAITPMLTLLHDPEASVRDAAAQSLSLIDRWAVDARIAPALAAARNGAGPQ